MRMINDDDDEDSDENFDDPEKKVKNNPVIKTLNQHFKKSVDNILPKTEKLKQEQQNDIIRNFNSEMLKMKKQLEESKQFKGD